MSGRDGHYVVPSAPTGDDPSIDYPIKWNLTFSILGMLFALFLSTNKAGEDFSPQAKLSQFRQRK